MVKNAKKIERILIAYDGSGYSHAALNELRNSGLPQKAEVLIISVSEIWLPIRYEDSEIIVDRDVSKYYEKHREQTNRDLTETRAIVSAAHKELVRYFPNWKINTEAVLGSPAKEILSKASEFKPDLVVVGPQGLSSDRETGLGSISHKILATARCSVRISRLKQDASLSRLKIMIGFDASYESMAAVRAVALRPWKIKPEVRLVTITYPFTLLEPGRVFQPIPGMSERRMAGEEKWVKTLAADALKILLDGGFSASLNYYSGNPRIILSREAQEWEADSIFLGAHSREFQQEFYSIGCVASAVASRANCSVEVVREPITN
ncbi:MAG: universal stress protein [Pyrinomonadaceae bacterium]|nr:universal stress protein [Chloracidobacterium sp.]